MNIKLSEQNNFIQWLNLHNVQISDVSIYNRIEPHVLLYSNTTLKILNIIESLSIPISYFSFPNLISLKLSSLNISVIKIISYNCKSLQELSCNQVWICSLNKLMLLLPKLQIISMIGLFIENNSIEIFPNIKSIQLNMNNELNNSYSFQQIKYISILFPNLNILNMITNQKNVKSFFHALTSYERTDLRVNDTFQKSFTTLSISFFQFTNEVLDFF